MLYKLSTVVIIFCCIIILGLLAPLTQLTAGTTGKISGVVKDKNTGEPLPGVNVFTTPDILPVVPAVN